MRVTGEPYPMRSAACGGRAARSNRWWRPSEPRHGDYVSIYATYALACSAPVAARYDNDDAPNSTGGSPQLRSLLLHGDWKFTLL